MPRYKVYIGEDNSEGLDWNTPSSAESGPPVWLLPSDFMGLSLIGYEWYKQVEKSGRYKCRQLDWGSWGVLVNKSNVLSIWGDLKPKEDRPKYVLDKWRKTRDEFEEHLVADKLYIICISEMA